MKAFVSGCTGLLGGNLSRLLAAEGCEVVGLVRSVKKGESLLGDTPIRFVQGDMRAVSAFGHELEGCDVVFHTAAYFRESLQPGNHAEVLDAVNVKGTLNLLDAADSRAVRRFVHVSSAGLIGRKKDGSPGDEDTPPLPAQTASAYLRSKTDGDTAVGHWQPEKDMEVIRVLPGWMWGPGDAAPTGAGQLALEFVARRVPGILDGGSCVVDVRDVATAMLAAVERGQPGRRYIVGGAYHTIEEIFMSLQRITGVRCPKWRVPGSLAMVYAKLVETYARFTGKPVLVTREGLRIMQMKVDVSSERAMRELDVTFRPLEETLRDLVDWYCEHPTFAGAASAKVADLSGRPRR
jgi:dihydroflavonol-4-reductase